MNVYVGNTNFVDLTGLKSQIDSSYLNAAAVTLTITNSLGVALPDVSWPVTMDYVAASNGNYRAILSHDLQLTSGVRYVAFIDADGSDDENERFGHWEIPFTATKRTS